MSQVFVNILLTQTKDQGKQNIQVFFRNKYPKAFSFCNNLAFWTLSSWNGTKIQNLDIQQNSAAMFHLDYCWDYYFFNYLNKNKTNWVSILKTKLLWSKKGIAEKQRMPSPEPEAYTRFSKLLARWKYSREALALKKSLK